MIRALLFDFGGVIAEEGFRDGLKAIARKNKIDPEEFFDTARELIYRSGYVAGLCEEASYWSLLREKTGISGSDGDNRSEILKRFVVRREMLKLASELQSAGFITGLLSDQTNWLDEINRKVHLFKHFDFVFNSFMMKKTKRDPSIFRDACTVMGMRPAEVLFVDDNADNVRKAAGSGLKTIHFTGVAEFERELREQLKKRL